MEKEFENILTRVGRLFFNYGIKSMTMDDISRELGMSKKTLYQFVKNKEDLVGKTLSLMDCAHDEEFTKFDRDNSNAIEALWQVNSMISKMIREQNPAAQYDLKKYYPQIFTDFRNKQVQKISDLIIRNLRIGKEQKLYREDINEELIAKFYLSRISHTTDIDSVFTYEELTAPDFMSQLMEYHIRGIASRKGIEILEEILNRETNN